MIFEFTEDCQATMVASIVDAWNQASDADMSEGTVWYPIAREIALTVSDDVTMGAGIIAALSPRMPWGRNVQLAFAHGRGTYGGCMGRESRNAAKIHQGADPLTVVVAPKTRSFLDNIVNCGTSQAVTVDTHAIAIACQGITNVPSITNKGVYEFIADAYRLATAKLGVELPSIVQAVTWVWWRRAGSKVTA